jgi:hypothetical protein
MSLLTLIGALALLAIPIAFVVGAIVGDAIEDARVRDERRASAHLYPTLARDVQATTRSAPQDLTGSGAR